MNSLLFHFSCTFNSLFNVNISQLGFYSWSNSAFFLATCWAALYRTGQKVCLGFCKLFFCKMLHNILQKNQMNFWPAQYMAFQPLLILHALNRIFLFSLNSLLLSSLQCYSSNCLDLNPRVMFIFPLPIILCTYQLITELAHCWLRVSHLPFFISPSTIITSVQALITYHIFYWKSIPTDLLASSFAPFQIHDYFFIVFMKHLITVFPYSNICEHFL